MSSSRNMLRNAAQTFQPTRKAIPRISPLLATRDDFQRLVAKERHRSDRYGLTFGLIVMRLSCPSPLVRRHLRRLAHILDQRLRYLDEKAHTDFSEITLLLPHTDRAGMQTVLARVTEAAAAREVYFLAETFVYPGSDDQGEHPFDSDHPFDEQRERLPSQPETFASEDVNVAPDVALETKPRKIKMVCLDERLEKNRLPTRPYALEPFAAGLMVEPYPWWKRCLDIIGAMIGLALSVPVLTVAALAIKLTSPGPIFFSQLRTGFYGRRFTIWKLRTMVPDAQELQAGLRGLNERDGPAFKIKNDPRVTRIGKFLRATGIDELPQLWNVLKGDMALVGPRPLPCREDGQCLQWHRRRLDTKPGLTCTWQVSKDREIPFNDWMRMDLQYADNRSFWKDMLLILRTFKTVLFGRAGR